MSYIGDFKLGASFDTKFTTRQISGAPFTLAGTPVISAYVDNSTTEITAGITLSVDFDSRTGLNNVRVVATGGNGYATASNYQLVITTGTVNGVSVVGEVIAEFSIENRRADVQFWNGTQVATPATAGIPDINVKNMNNVAASAITTIKAVQGLAVDGVITTLTNLPAITANWLTAAGTAADFGAELATAIWTDTTAGDFTVAASVGKSVMNGVALGTGLTVNDLTTKTGFALTSAYDAAKTAAQAGNAMTLTAAYDAAKTAAQAGDAMALTGGERTTLAGVINTTAIVESYRANGATPTPAQFMSEVLAHLGESSISTTTKTIKKLDHSTSAATFTLDSATTPASITRAT